MHNSKSGNIITYRANLGWCPIPRVQMQLLNGTNCMFFLIGVGGPIFLSKKQLVGITSQQLLPPTPGNGYAIDV